MKTATGKMHLAVIAPLFLSGAAQAQLDATAEPGRPSYNPATAMCMRPGSSADPEDISWVIVEEGWKRLQ
ncbi:hypothetical protein UNDKW_3813 [Undibacterium sp. KW1]|uniref:hypothetical protein n=1 Tax=Undibacterium sp. KW1 TaxID=2058624 RepID=UPI001331E0F4|nr:hypothetical protein [Undibacterium sp. KW1]BBB62086.1 hypothetical protein UNDKW_3813 [Undibacterium sp. KW1]